MMGSIAAKERGRGRQRKLVYLGSWLAEPTPPELLGLLERHRNRSDVLITVLQEIQALYGYLPERSLRHAARELGMPLARVYGVATFYNQFRFSPPGRIQLRVCCGTACHVGGAPAILDALQSHLNVSAEQTTSDGMFTLQTVFCVGGCSLAPVVIANENAHGRMTSEGVVSLVEGLRAAEGGEP